MQGEARVDHVLEDVEIHEKPVLLPVAGHEEDAFFDGFIGMAQPQLPALQEHLAPGPPQHAAHHEDQVLLPLVGKPADAEDLPFARAQADSAHLLFIGDILQFQRGLRAARVSRPGSGGGFPLLRPACNEGNDEVLVPRLGPEVHDSRALAAAEGVDDVADPHDLPQTVGDEDHRHAVVLQVGDLLEELLHVEVLKRGGGLVEDEQARLLQQRLGDLHHLLLLRGEVHHLLVDGQIAEIELVQERARPLPCHAVVGEGAEGPRLGTQADVLPDGELGNEAEVLVHVNDAVAPRIRRGPDLHGLSVDQQ